jgi:hypothetical protein
MQSATEKLKEYKRKVKCLDVSERNAALQSDEFKRLINEVMSHRGSRSTVAADCNHCSAHCESHCRDHHPEPEP